MRFADEHFYKNHARYKLAEIMKADPSFVKLSIAGKPSKDWDLKYLDDTFIVKFSKPKLHDKKKKQKIWDFDVRQSRMSKKKDVSYFMLVGIVKNSPEKLFIIPSSEIPKTHVRISMRNSGKYKQFEYEV